MISRKFENSANVTGKAIEKARKSKHMTRALLSNQLMMLGIDINYDGIYKIENGRRIVKDFELSFLCKVSEISETQLLEDFRKNLNL